VRRLVTPAGLILTVATVPTLAAGHLFQIVQAMQMPKEFPALDAGLTSDNPRLPRPCAGRSATSRSPVVAMAAVLIAAASPAFSQFSSPDDDHMVPFGQDDVLYNSGMDPF
jgi:hypothetical protein